MKVLFSEISHTVLDIKPDKRTDVWNFGVDNGYPSLINQLIAMSVSSKACTDKVAKAIYGKSFGVAGKVPINKDGQSLNDLLRVISREYSKHNNVFISVGYDATFKINSLKLVPNTHARKGKSDDKGYSGKIVVYSNWDRQESKRIDSTKFQIVDVYNPNEAVIKSQVEKAGGFKEYRGQILHIQQDTSAVYSLSDLNSVLPEALLEANSQAFRSRGASKGFLNTKLMVVQPFSDDDEREEFEEDLESLQGGENSGGVLVLEARQTTDNIDNQMKLEDLSGVYNDELFQYSDKQAKANIALATGVPVGLIDVTDNTLFAQSGELIKTMKVMLWESREEDRDMIEEMLTGLMSKWSDGTPEDLKIINPFETKTEI